MFSASALVGTEVNADLGAGLILLFASIALSFGIFLVYTVWSWPIHKKNEVDAGTIRIAKLVLRWFGYVLIVPLLLFVAATYLLAASRLVHAFL